LAVAVLRKGHPGNRPYGKLCGLDWRKGRYPEHLPTRRYREDRAKL